MNVVIKRNDWKLNYTTEQKNIIGIYQPFDLIFIHKITNNWIWNSDKLKSRIMSGTNIYSISSENKIANNK